MTTTLEEDIRYALAVVVCEVTLVGDGNTVGCDIEEEGGKVSVRLKTRGVKKDVAWNCFFNNFLRRLRDYPEIKSA